MLEIDCIQSNEDIRYQDQTALLFCSIRIILNLEKVFFKGGRDLLDV